MPEVSNGWALLGLVAVLLHQMAGRWWDSRESKISKRRWAAIKAEQTESRAWRTVSDERFVRIEAAIKLIADNIARPSDPSHE